MKHKFTGKCIAIESRTKTTYRTDFKEWDKKNMQTLLKTLVGKDVDVTIGEHRNTRSNKQNSYLNGVPYKIIGKHFNADRDSVHNEMRNMFLLEDSEGPVKKVKSTAKLTTVEFMKYVDEIIQWAAEVDGIYIPYPNEEEMWGSIK